MCIFFVNAVGLDVDTPNQSLIYKATMREAKNFKISKKFKELKLMSPFL